MLDLSANWLAGGGGSDFASGSKPETERSSECLARDRFGAWKRARIIDTRTLAKDGNDDVRREFYVHYNKTDRRLDEWVDESRLRKTATRREGRRRLKDDRISLRARRPRSPSSSAASANPLPTVETLDTLLEQQHEMLTKVKYIEELRYAEFLVDTWYVSPYPDECGRARRLHVCHNCLRYFADERAYRVHLGVCRVRTPPGREIYRECGLTVYEVDGSIEKFYAQCLCLLAKLFLDHKTIYFDVSGFLFYIVCRFDPEHGATMAGYFSKERESAEDNNLNCILVLPPFQQHGYGAFLIQLSYELSRREGRPGSPEKPLSDLGARGYLAFWKYAIVEQLSAHVANGRITVQYICENTGMSPTDVRETLEKLGLTLHRRAEETQVTMSQITELKRTARPPKLLLNTRLLKWKPT